MNANINNDRDRLETAIILALHSGKMMDAKGKAIKNGDGWELQEIHLDQFCPTKNMKPKDCFITEGRGDRLYTADLSQIVVDPVSAIGARLETMMVCDDGSLKWNGIRPMNPPRGLAAISNRPVRWFEFHFRHIGNDGRNIVYVRRPFCISNGDVVMIRVMGSWRGFNPESDRAEMREQLALVLSVYEDAVRENSYLATVEDGVRLSFPVGSEAYREYFALRDAPTKTPTGRRNPILHWCAKHIRRTPRGKDTSVRRHERGVSSITVGPMTLSLESNEGRLLLADSE